MDEVELVALVPAASDREYDDGKEEKIVQQEQSISVTRILGILFVAGILAVGFTFRDMSKLFFPTESSSKTRIPASTTSDWFPKSIQTSSDASKSDNLSGSFTAKLDSRNCSISFAPPSAREQADWLHPFWVPSFPSSGSANPSKQGDLVKQLTNGKSRTTATKILLPLPLIIHEF